MTLKLEAYYVAVIPLVMFVCSFGTALVMKFANRRLGNVGAFSAGACAGLAACAWVWAGCAMGTPSVLYEIYGVAALVGVAGSAMLVTSLAVTAHLIGENAESGAFVYGSMSLR